MTRSSENLKKPSARAVGAYKFLIHAGKHTENEQTPAQRTVPEYLLPANLLPESGICPDIMLIRGWHEERDNNDTTPSARAAPTPADAHITLVPAEVAVCCDDIVLKAVQRKHAYYQQLIQKLRTAGWRVLGQNDDGTISDTAPNIITLPFGNTGLTYSPTVPALQALGIPAHAARTLQKQISREMPRTISTILAVKRELEAHLPPDLGPPCPPSQLPFKRPHTTFAQGRPLQRGNTTITSGAAAPPPPPPAQTHTAGSTARRASQPRPNRATRQDTATTHPIATTRAPAGLPRHAAHRSKRKRTGVQETASKRTHAQAFPGRNGPTRHTPSNCSPTPDQHRHKRQRNAHYPTNPQNNPPTLTSHTMTLRTRAHTTRTVNPQNQSNQHNHAARTRQTPPNHHHNTRTATRLKRGVG